MENKVYKVLSEWKLDNLKEKFKDKKICRLWIYISMDGKVSIVLASLQFSTRIGFFYCQHIIFIFKCIQMFTKYIFYRTTVFIISLDNQNTCCVVIDSMTINYIALTFHISKKSHKKFIEC